MQKIGIISDTHGCFDEPLKEFLRDVDQIWHAGDFGNQATADAIASFKPLVGVYGNIDDHGLRLVYPQYRNFRCEDVDVLMTHIGGYPGKYAPGIREKLGQLRPKLFVTGHSHILRVKYDESLGVLYVNPGAAGCYGFHRVRTAIRMIIDGDRMCDMQVGEWQR